MKHLHQIIFRKTNDSPQDGLFFHSTLMNSNIYVGTKNAMLIKTPY